MARHAFTPTSVQRRFVTLNANASRNYLARQLNISETTLLKYFRTELGLSPTKVRGPVGSVGIVGMTGPLGFTGATGPSAPQLSPAERARQILQQLRAQAGVTQVTTATVKTTKGAAKPKKSPSNHGTRWTSSDDNRLVAQFKAGTSVDGMAKLMGRTTYAVLGRLHSLGYLTFDRTNLTYYTKPTAYFTIT